MSGVSKTKKSTREDELLLQFSNNVTARNSATFYGNAAIVAALPICEYGSLIFERCEFN